VEPASVQKLQSFVARVHFSHPSSKSTVELNSLLKKSKR